MTPNEALQAAKDALDKAISEKKQNQALLQSLGPAIIDALKPSLEKITENSRLSKVETKDLLASIGPSVIETLRPILEHAGENMGVTTEFTKQIVDAVKGIKLAPVVNVSSPQIKIPEISIPEIKVPVVNVPKPEVTVNMPPIKFPKLTWPTENMPIEGWVKLQGIDLQNPLPVQIMNPRDIGGSGSAVIGGGGSPLVTVTNDANHPIPVSGSFSVSGTSTTAAVLTNRDGTLYNSDNPLPITGSLSTTPGSTFFASDAILSVNVIQSLGSATPVGTGYQDNALRVVNATDAITSVNLVSSAALVVTSITNSTAVVITDSGGVAYSGSNPLPTTASVTLSAAIGQGDGSAALRTIQAGDTVSSTNLLQIAGTATAVGSGVTNPGTLRVINVTDSISSVGLYFADGTAVNQSAGNLMVNVGNLAIGTLGGSDNNVTGTTSGMVFSELLGYDSTGDNWDRLRMNTGEAAGALRVVQALDSISSVFVTGSADSTLTYMARTTNPTAVADGADVRPSADKLGRQLMRPVQVRELILTAYTTLSTGTETTILTAAAGTYADLLYIGATNTSTVAVQIDIRAVSGGNIIHTLYIPASTGPVGFAPNVPWPQDATGNAWTVDMADITGTTVYISGLFSKET